jgi:hypothetical protein
MEADAVSGKAFDVDLYGQLTDRLGRCLQGLGLERKARDVRPHQAQPPPKIQETLELMRSRFKDIIRHYQAESELSTGRSRS